MTTRDPLTLQNFLITCAKPLGGTWHPAPATVGDVAIKCSETQVLGDGSTMQLTIIIGAVLLDTDKPRLLLTHLLNVRSAATCNPANPASAQASSYVPCAFATVDEVLAAIDETTANVNEQMAALIAGLEAAHV